MTKREEKTSASEQQIEGKVYEKYFTTLRGDIMRMLKKN